MFHIINSALSSLNLFLAAQLCSLACKAYILISLIRNDRLKSNKKIFFLFMAVIFGGMVSDFAWIMNLLTKIFSFVLSYRTIISITSISWAFYIIQYQSFAFFLESLINKNLTLNKRHLFFLSLCFMQCLFFLSYVTIFSPFLSSFNDVREQYPYLITWLIYSMRFSPTYIFTLMGFALYITVKKLVQKTLPAILNKQLYYVITLFIIPHLIFEFLTYLPIRQFVSPEHWLAFSNKIASISTLLVTITLFVCYKRMLGLRFLNHNDHVEARVKFSFIDDYKHILDRLSNVTSPHEFVHIAQLFFHKTFNIPSPAISFYLRESHVQNKVFSSKLTNIEFEVETFFMHHYKADSPVKNYLDTSKILIKDEIEFTNFYENDHTRATILQFLDTINSAIFLPIYDGSSICAYIIVNKNARPKELFNDLERNEMLVFTKHLGHVNSLLNHANFNTLLKREKELKEEIYRNEQHLNHYKESIRFFYRSCIERKIGLLYFKKDYFTIANDAARELIGFDINKNQKHSLHTALKELAQKALYCKSAQSTSVRDSNGNKLMISATPSLELTNVTIMIYCPEISDMLASQFDLLNDQTQRDYLLYLETTQAGKAINELIPSDGQIMLNFKIKLMAAALTSKAILLQMSDDDLMATVEILHNLSGREILHTIKLSEPERNGECFIKLFGVNSLYGSQSENDQIVQKLDKKGTLFIKNVDFLSLQTQRYLAEFITYGFYHRFKSERKFFSDVRIMCSTNRNLTSLIAENLFSKELYAVLQETSLNMPSLLTLPAPEILGLAQGFTNQATTPVTYKNLVPLNDNQKSMLLEKGCYSLQELKEKIYSTIQKSNKRSITTEVKPARKVSTPDLERAAALGTKALRDPQIMLLLWQTFKSQSRIAEFLGVNRSSVYKRCREYKLGQDDKQPTG